MISRNRPVAGPLVKIGAVFLISTLCAAAAQAAGWSPAVGRRRAPQTASPPPPTAVPTPAPTAVTPVTGAEGSAPAAAPMDPIPGSDDSDTIDPAEPGAAPYAEPPSASLVRETPPSRPRFSAAVGMGVSLDDSGFVRGRTVPVPAFHVQLGAGGGFLGFELRLTATQAAGRYHQREIDAAGTASAADTPADRLGLDALLALRPLTYRYRDADTWLERVLATLAITVGFSAENASTGTPSVVRWGPVAGAQLDFPLVDTTASSRLGIRVASRRMFGGEKRAGTVPIKDTAQELLGGLVLVF